jgi:hypothetical protein
MENLVCYPGIVFYAPGLYDLLILSASATEKGAVITEIEEYLVCHHSIVVYAHDFMIYLFYLL